MRVLLVKMSSLGDVVHTLPGVSDAAAALPAGVAFDWVVEEAFAAIPARHAAVSSVIPVAWRRWRRQLATSGSEMREFVGRLRERHYDLVLDAQGLLKSAAVTTLARGRSAGLSRTSAREGAAALFYRRQVPVPRGQHAIERIRGLFAAALDYRPPAGPPDYGIAGASSAIAGRPAAAIRRCVLLHGTTWQSKLWPVRFWRDLAERAADAGFQVAVPWGSDAERRRAEAIAAGTAAMVLPPLPLSELVDVIAEASLAVGVDSGLSHLAAALEVPTLVLYGPTDSALTGVRGARARNLQSDFPGAPCMTRVCTYPGPAPQWQGEPVMPACFSRLPPDVVWRAASRLLTGSDDADRLLHI